MDPVTLAAQAVAVLSPYLVEAGKKVAGNVGEAAWKQAVTLYQSIKTRLAGHPASEALEDLAQAPEDEDIQATLRVALKKLLEKDTTFARELAGLLPTAPVAGPSFTNTIAGKVGAITQVAGSVHTLAVSVPPPAPPTEEKEKK